MVCGRGHRKISECWEYAFLSTVTYLCSLCDNSLNCMCLYIVDISVQNSIKYEETKLSLRYLIFSPHHSIGGKKINLECLGTTQILNRSSQIFQYIEPQIQHAIDNLPGIWSFSIEYEAWVLIPLLTTKDR